MSPEVRQGREGFGIERGPVGPEGFPWLENGERLDQPGFHERYEQTPDAFFAELIGGVVHVTNRRPGIRHGRALATLGGWLFCYSAATEGTEAQSRTTTILGNCTEVQPDLSLIVRSSSGGQSREGADDFIHGPPELIVEIALRTIDRIAREASRLRSGRGPGISRLRTPSLRRVLVREPRRTFRFSGS